MFIGKKVLFDYVSNYIDSVYAFDDGDFILFGVFDMPLENPNQPNIQPNNETFVKSTLIDGKTFKPKLILNVSSNCAFFNLANDEFAICNSFCTFQINKFNKDRTSYDKIQTLSSLERGSAKYLRQMSNRDLCINRSYVGYCDIYIFRYSESNPKYEPYGSKYLYNLEGVSDLINLKDNEILAYKINHGSDSLTLKILDSNDYKIKRQNQIKFIDNNQRRIYISLPFYKINNDKIITGGAKCLYIFGLDNLELETTIQIENNISKILIRPKNNLFLLFSGETKVLDVNEITDCVKFYHSQYINNLKIDFETNDIIESKKENITKYSGRNKQLFDMYNYINNGFISLKDKSQITIYEDCDD